MALLKNPNCLVGYLFVLICHDLDVAVSTAIFLFLRLFLLDTLFLTGQPYVISTHTPDGGLPLESFNRPTPLGWRAGDKRYPLRRYTQLLRLWWRITDLPEVAAGPAMAGRLRGSAFQLAVARRTAQGAALRGSFPRTGRSHW